jgi:hypothetical protein
VGQAGILLQAGAYGAHTWLPLGLRPGDTFNQIDGATPEAIAAGVHRGDLIVAAQGVPIDTAHLGEDQARALLRHQMAVGEGERIVLMLRSQAGTAHPVVLVHRARSAQALLAPSGLAPEVLTWLAVGFFALVPLVLTGASALLVSRRRETVAAMLSLSLLALACVAGNQTAFWEANGMQWLGLALVNLAVGGLAVTLLAFPAGTFVPGWSRWIAISVPPVLLIAVFVPVIAVAVLDAILIVPAAVLVLRYRAEPAEARRQWRWAMLGFVLGLVFWCSVGALFSFVIYPVLPNAVIGPWSWLITPGIFAVTALLIAGGLVLSLLRYRLYDAPVVISQSLFYGGMTLSLVAIFAGTEKIIEIIGEEWFGESIGALAGGLGAAFAAVAIGPLHHRIGHFVEHRFRGDLVQLRRDGPALIEELVESGDRDHLVSAVCALLAERLHVVRADLADAAQAAPGSAASAHAGALMIDAHDPRWPIRADLGHGAMLRIGPRPDGSLCDAQEREAIGDIAARLGQGLRIMARRQARDQALLLRIARIEAALAAVAVPTA